MVMMETHKEQSVPWKTTIITSTFLKHEASRMLTAQQHRIRASDSLEEGVFIFPLSGTAFLLVKPEDLPEPVGQSELTEKIEKFVQIHRNSFVLLHSPFNGKKELETLALIQRRFFGSNLRVLPVRNTAEMVTGMLMIAKATSRPHVDNIRERMALARAHVMEGSPVWEMLRDLL
ncbi:protein SPO16 homolog [Gouania willdenowi]|uniref:Uncharacterized protein n=1 Tax=Gouania willdenowi TaxID=441366 RepID=A0A8C5E7W6_GOUWI|nr:uncharacterized protein C1orf146 homolog [Gouania willdenowi]XP_028300808.1 uncharacterized protein C1orf146 homolog [Gouania willdenowi]